MNGKVFFKYLATHYISDREKYNEFYLVDVDARKKNKCNKRKMLKFSMTNGVKATCLPRVWHVSSTCSNMLYQVVCEQRELNRLLVDVMEDGNVFAYKRDNHILVGFFQGSRGFDK